MRTKTIRVPYLARVEGEGSLFVRIKDGQVDDVKLSIFEPPRFFEAFLRGRRFSEAPDITARICGICHIAYSTSAVQAFEQAYNVGIDTQIRNLRRLVYLGEWIKSHILHVAMLHAPDFLGFQDAFQMAKSHPDFVTTALELKKLGNDIVTLIGGREIHSVNLCVGGFYRAVTPKELEPLIPRLEWGMEASRQILSFTTGFEFPNFERDYDFVALSSPSEYAITEGRIISNRRLNIDIAEFEREFVEEQVEHATALHSIHRKQESYCVGPLARYNLNFNQLTANVKATAEKIGMKPPVLNPFKSIVVRVLETLYACEDALRLVRAYKAPDKPASKVNPVEATARGCTEAPRGLLYHRYTTDEDGIITGAKIVPPTSQNLKTMEEDLWEFVPPRVELPNNILTWQCEQAIRNYDPCISCATHLLKLKIKQI